MIEQLTSYYSIVMTFINSNVYIKAIAIFLAFFICSKIVYWIFVKIFMRLVKHTETTVDDQIVEVLKKPVTTILVMLGVYFGIQVFALENNTFHIIDKIVYTLILIVITYILIRVVDIFIGEWGQKLAAKTESTLDDALMPILHKTAMVVLGIIGFLYILTVWGIAIGPFLASLGIAGLALGLALQDTLKNIFGGMSLLLDKSYTVGDVVEFEGGVVGTIHDIGLRSTKVATFDGQLIGIPNGAIANQRVLNRGLPNKNTRVDVNFGVAYGTKHEDVKKYITAVIKESFKEDLLKQKGKDIEVVFLSMGDSALNFSARFWIADVSNRFPCQIRATELIYDELNRRKISIPFPQMDVHLNVHKEGKRK